MSLIARTIAGRVALNALQCLSGRDWEQFRACLTPDIVVEWPFAGRAPVIYRGPDKVIAVFRALDIFTAFKLDVTSLFEFADENLAISQAQSLGVSGDGRPDYVNRYVFFHYVKDGKISIWREYFNPVEGNKSFGRADNSGLPEVSR